MRVYVVGLGKNLDFCLNYLRAQKNIEIAGILSDRKQCFSQIDGYPLLYITDAKIEDIDAVICTRDETDKRLCFLLGDSYREKMIYFRCFFIPGLDT